MLEWTSPTFLVSIHHATTKNFCCSHCGKPVCSCSPLSFRFSSVLPHRRGSQRTSRCRFSKTPYAYYARSWQLNKFLRPTGCTRSAASVRSRTKPPTSLEAACPWKSNTSLRLKLRFAELLTHVRCDCRPLVSSAHRPLAGGDLHRARTRQLAYGYVSHASICRPACASARTPPFVRVRTPWRARSRAHTHASVFRASSTTTSRLLCAPSRARRRTTHAPVRIRGGVRRRPTLPVVMQSRWLSPTQTGLPCTPIWASTRTSWTSTVVQ